MDKISNQIQSIWLHCIGSKQIGSTMHPQKSNFESTHQVLGCNLVVLLQYSLLLGSFHPVICNLKLYFPSFLCYHIIFREFFGPISMLCVAFCLDVLPIYCMTELARLSL